MFVWITVLIIAIAILFFGIKIIKQSEELKDDVIIAKFFNDFQKKIDQYYFLDVGSKGQERFSIPADVKSICFAEGNLNQNGLSERDFNYINNLKNDFNIFIFPIDIYENNRAKLKNIYANGIKCFDVNGVLTVNLENKGVTNGVEIL